MNAPVNSLGRPGHPDSSTRPCFRLAPDRTPWKKLAIDGVRTATCDGADGVANCA